MFAEIDWIMTHDGWVPLPGERCAIVVDAKVSTTGAPAFRLGTFQPYEYGDGYFATKQGKVDAYDVLAAIPLRELVSSAIDAFTRYEENRGTLKAEAQAEFDALREHLDSYSYDAV